MAPSPFATEAEILEIGGWDARYASVLAVAQEGRFAVALVDTNSDGRNIELQQFWRDDRDRWTQGPSSGPEPDRVGFVSRGSLHGAHYAYGRASADELVTVRLAGREVTTRATGAGWWAFVIDDE